MLRLMVSKGYFLARRDTVRESSSFCSVVSSAMRRLYLRACEKSIDRVKYSLTPQKIATKGFSTDSVRV